MKRESAGEQNRTRTIVCPDCGRSTKASDIKSHIEQCQKYIPTYVNNINRCLAQFSSNYLEFLSAEMDIIKEQLATKIQQARSKKPQIKAPQHERPSKDTKSTKSSISAQKGGKQLLASEIVKKNEEASAKIVSKDERSRKQQGVGEWEGTLLLDEANSNQIFRDERRPNSDEKIICASPTCKDPASINSIQKFTYLDQCLHTICLFCLRDYVRNSYVRLKGQIKCPGQCEYLIPYIQIKQTMDANVLMKLENDLNSQSFDLIECQKCHEHYQFEKGKPSDAPKKSQQGKNITPSMAKHYAENRFQCPKCRTQQCKNCKSIPYHIGFTCQDFEEHKKKKKCRYCHSVLPKGYMSETGIKTFDDICDSEECSSQTKQACSKMLQCGHPCYGYIREKNCLPCLSQACALAKTSELHGQNQNSYCSLCYVEVLSQSPCVRSKCGHIFHFKCLKKRLQLKWETARIIFRFCECPLCNKWMELPEESPLNKVVTAFRLLYNKIKEKAVKRLTHEGANKDAVLTDPTSAYFKNQEKYATTIYAYFQCFQCHQPYFGGRKSCAQAMNDLKAGQKFNPKELICPSCCPVEATDCKKHGKEFISFKCKFCCSVAQWFCWGNTHFCDDCHKKQINGEYISRIPKEKLPKCEGKGICPVGGEHGGNGEEFCLGCGVCRGQRLDSKDF